jgi:hypothetical protein
MINSDYKKDFCAREVTILECAFCRGRAVAKRAGLPRCASHWQTDGLPCDYCGERVAQTRRGMYLSCARCLRLSYVPVCVNTRLWENRG